METQDRELAERCRLGDPAAMDALVERYRPQIRRLIRRLVRCEETADDLTQETFVRALRRIETFRGDAPILAWLQRIAVNLCTDAQRSAALRHQRSLPPDDLLHPEEEPDPLDAVLARERREYMARLLETLSPLQQVLLRLRYHAGMEPRAIAEALELSESTVTSSLSRALARLRERYGRIVAPARDPDAAARVHQSIGRAYLNDYRFPEAIREYEAAAAIKPDDPDVLLALANAYVHDRRTLEAIRTCARVLAMRPGCGEAHQVLALALQRENRWDEAVQEFQRALGDPHLTNRAQTYNWLGNTYARMRRFDDALQAYAEALRLSPTMASVWSNRGNVFLETGRYAEAVQCYTRALRLRPTLFPAYFNRGCAKQEMGDLEGAAEDYRRCMEMASWWVEPHAALGLALQKLGRTAEAEAQFRTVLSMRPTEANGMFYQACVLVAVGRAAEAVPLLEQALAAQPEWDEARRKLEEARRLARAAAQAA